MMRTIHFTIAYDGTDFHGWQQQPGLRTVEGALREALSRLLRYGGLLVAASRTDAGVHARGQSAHFYTGSTLDCHHMARALNRYLPPDVAVTACADAPPDFSARHNLGKHYRYELWLAAYDDPLTRRFHWWYHYPLDLDAMRAAAAQMTGTLNLRGLQMVSGKQHEETTRVVNSVTLTCAGPRVSIDIIGKSFMYKQVRAMVGVLLAVGRGRIPADAVREVLAGTAGPRRFDVAAPHGLTLMQVFY